MYQFKVNPKRQRDRWEFLSTRNVRHRGNWDNERPESAKDLSNQLNSPFDCSDIIDHDLDFNKLASKDISEAISKWRKLNERRIVLNDQVGKRQGRKRDNESKVFLPFEFDYETNLDTPPTFFDEESTTGGRVIDLTNPDNELYYETELWKIFKSLRKAEDFENIIKEKISVASISNAPKQTMSLKNSIDAAQTDRIIDIHSMCRLRVKSRHHFPSSGSAEITEVRHGYKVWGLEKSSQAASNDTTVMTSFLGDTSIRVELMRNQYSRGSQQDNNRLELEFLASHSLLDIHRAISEQYRDTSSDLCPSLHSDSGLFFIENVFYVTGNADYSKEVLEWLKAADGPRFDALGISMRNLCVRPMCKTLLNTLSIRIGTRYVHFTNGDIQTNMFFTCIRPLTCNELISKEDYPITLDDWYFNSNLSSICYACQQFAAVCICFDDNFTTGDPTMLCSRCYFSLHYDSNGALRVSTSFRVYPLDLCQRKAHLKLSSNETH